MDWSMGGYGFYVWGSYLCTFVVIGLEVFALVKRKRACAQQSKEDRLKPSHSPQTGVPRLVDNRN